MEATRRLTEEHREIEKGLPMVSRIVGPHTGISMSSDEIVEFFRVFADACHHRKEEVVLFPALEKHGLSRKSGLLRELLMEHGTARRLLREITGLLSPASEDFPTSHALLVDRIQDYVAHLRAHIAREEEELWPRVEAAFTAAEDDEIAAGYDRVDDEVGQQSYRKYLRWARAWGR